MNNSNQIRCPRCIMDSSAEDFYLINEGCSFCESFNTRLQNNGIVKEIDLSQYVDRIKKLNKKSKYDCIVGVSGGVDSSMVLVKAKELGLNPLAVHMDNGWNSELAQNNINNLIRKLNVDLITYVINWNEYRQLMDELFQANVIDVELLYDNAMLAVNYQIAEKFGIKTILSGMNTSTEGMAMPKNWNWFKYDQKQIKFFKKKLKLRNSTFPSIGTNQFLYYTFIKKITWEHFLDYFEFNKESALSLLEKDFGYKRYPYKHYESVFTRFYQGYILPKKFGVDKRKLHLSTLIITKQMTRDEGLELLDSLPYAGEIELEQDKRYFLKKMKWSEEKLNRYLSVPETKHSEYPSEKEYWDLLINLKKKI